MSSFAAITNNTTQGSFKHSYVFTPQFHKCLYLLMELDGATALLWVLKDRHQFFLQPTSVSSFSGGDRSHLHGATFYKINNFMFFLSLSLSAQVLIFILFIIKARTSRLICSLSMHLCDIFSISIL